MIDEHELISVLQILKDGTISQAAKNLFLSQPSLSQCIKKIENELGMQIFDRRQTPLQLTAFDDEEFIVLKQGRRMCQIYNKLCDGTKVTPHVVFEADSIMSAAELCAKGMGATLVTDMVIDRSLWKEPPFFFELEETVEKRHLVAAYSRQQILPRAAQVFLQFIK